MKDARIRKGNTMSAADKKQKWKRSRFFNFSIKKEMQFRMLIRIWLILLTALVVFGVVFYFYSDITIGTSFRQIHIKADNFLNFLLPVILMGFGVSFVVGFLGALVFPHPIVGPIYRMELELLEVGKGDLSRRIKLREKDSCKDLAENINKMTEGLQEKIRGIDDYSEKLAGIVDGVPDKEVSPDVLREIRTTSAALQKALKEFRL